MELKYIKNVNHRLGGNEFYYFHHGVNAGGVISPVLFTPDEVTSAILRANRATEWRLSRELLPGPRRPTF
ncbi:MAG: hypothetical protein WC373_15900, partial [Smithella sp.]